MTDSLPDSALPPPVRPRDWLGAVLFPTLLALLFLIARQFGLDDLAKDRASLDATLAAWGMAAPLVFVFAYSFLPLMFVPRAVLALLGGYLFGWPSVLYTWSGALLGESIAYGLARTLARPLVEKIAVHGDRGRQAVAWLRAEGFWAVLIMRLFPFIPTDVINFGSGLAGVAYRDFAVGTLLGILPGCLIFSYYGQLFEGRPLELIYSIPVFLGPMLLAVLVARWRYGGRDGRAPGATA